METGRQSKRSGRDRRGAPEPRVVVIEYRPVPDAEARLRRIATILLRHADRTDPPPGDGHEPEGR